MEKADSHQKKLLQSLKNGDEKAFKSIFDRYHQRLYYFVFSFTKSDYSSQEILQEVFIKLWSIRDTIDSSLSFDSFIYTMTRNMTLNHLRAVSKRESLRRELWKNVDFTTRQTEEILLLTEYEDIVDDILNSLPKQKRSVFILSKRQGKSNQEIADLLGISPKTVKNHLWKALQLIKVQLRPHLTSGLKVLFSLPFL